MLVKVVCGSFIFRVFSIHVVLLFLMTEVMAAAELSDHKSTPASYNQPTSLIKPHKNQHSKTHSIHKLLKKIQGLPEMNKVHLINSFFNRFRNISDFTLWGSKEYWATPNELMNQNGGDCEDLAVAKYHYLTKSGINENNLRLAYAKAINHQTKSIENHLVLLYLDQSNKQEFVLDNIDKTVKATTKRNDLSYQFSFNRNNIWPMKEHISEMQIKRSGIFKSWTNVLKRM